ncbi:transglycosylase SLT domain-containing protein [Rhodovibrio salinarum]|uniref:DUF3393 domain-containing protein n=1 Tax=Rhodovibrio salinarum TaxID=1087 RepID=A0A934QKI6_9PROT|nr:transglycosylase SLT domain-containing protein [Rhodovibrio salinarum]MBK1698225.1 DUF3393 domain-containing protein [Rhodovibrio salinarum]
MKRRSLITGLSGVLAASTLSRPGLADLLDDDRLDAFDRRVDQEFEAFDRQMDARFAAMDRAIKTAFAEMDRRLRRRWGEAVQLPSEKTWVGYDGNRDERIIVDYERGRIVVQVQGVTDPAELHRRLDRVLQADSETLDQRDVVGQYIQEQASLAGGSAVSDGGRQGQDGGGSHGPELGPLVDRDARPEVSSKPIENNAQGAKVAGTIEVPMLPDHTRLSAQRVAPVARRFARNGRIPLSLVLSIIKNESAFNPRAKSRIPAFGLMQLVPSSGGRDAFRHVHGEDKAPSPAYLYQPTQNIELGCGYLNLLTSRYLADVRDPKSREFCVIAAYNTGAGNVAKTFAGTMSVPQAARQINRLPPTRVYDRLQANLPYDETKAYLRKVVRDREAYREFDA